MIKDLPDHNLLTAALLYFFNLALCCMPIQAQTMVEPIKRFLSPCLPGVIKESKESAASDCSGQDGDIEYQYLAQFGGANCWTHEIYKQPILVGCPYDYMDYLAHGTTYYGCRWTQQMIATYSPRPIQASEPPCPSNIDKVNQGYGPPPPTFWFCPDLAGGGPILAHENSPPTCTMPAAPRDEDCDKSCPE